MASRNRETLKRYFAKGQMPTEDSFTDLIDSMHNIIDDGQAETLRSDELDVSPNENGKTIGFYADKAAIMNKPPDWSMNLDRESSDFSVNHEDLESILHLTKEGQVGINTKEPISALDVNGIIASEGRIGNYKFVDVPADGNWHSVLSDLDGCYLFEVVAGARGGHKSGKFALLHAIASTTYNSCNKIRATQAQYGSYFHRIRLRWYGSEHSFALQVKTRSNYGSGCFINVQLSTLWLDPTMNCCLGS